MDQNREEMLREVMAADFMVEDLHLFLDTHPNDQRALVLYNCSVQRAMVLRYNFERMYGPLSAHHSFSNYPWQWINPPWPWQRQ